MQVIRTHPTPWIIGHRGAMGYAPENTLLSFEKAIHMGVHAIEFDIHTCASGEWVVIHDDRVDRTTNGNGKVSGLDYTYLKTLNAGQDQIIPLLSDVLDWVGGRCTINIEIKSEGNWAALQTHLQKAVNTSLWSWEQFIFSSFNHHWLALLHKLIPQVKIGALTASLYIDYAKVASDLGAHSINCSRECIDKYFVQDAHARGLKIFVYTVNHPDDMQTLWNMGVDGVFTNYPDLGMASIQSPQTTPEL